MTDPRDRPTETTDRDQVVISRPTATDDRPSQAERSISLSERTLLLGPSNVGKTRNTARALETYVEIHDPDGVVVLEFAPVLERDGVLLGGRLDRFVSIPDAVWTGVLDAHAPRVEADETVDATELARINARHAAEVFQAAPSDPKAVFINDATIPFQHECSAPELLLAYCEPADCVVANAFESDELGVDDPVSREERTALETLRSWADRTITLE